MKKINKIFKTVLVIALIIIIKSNALAKENLINEFLNEQNEKVNYFYQTGQISEKKQYQNLETVYEDFVKINGEIFETFEEYEDFIIEDMKSKHEIEQELEENSTLEYFTAINKSKVYTGDIVVTNNSFSFGLTGHAGFVVDNNKVLTINGPGKHPVVESFDRWIKGAKDNGAWIQIIRPKDKALSTHRHIAKTWALKNYTNNGIGKTNIKYGISKNLPSINPTYCSKIPFQAYKFGAKIGHDLPSSNKIITSYSLKDYFKDNPTSQFEHSIKNYY